MRVAVVCHGNICRSPMAETVGRALVDAAGLSGEVSVESFGTSGYHAGDGADPRAVDALARHGWPARAHRARRLTREALEASDLVLCADRENLDDVRRLAGPGEASKVRLLRSYDPAAAPGDDEVPDPWYGGAQEFDAALEMIERSLRGLVDELGAARR